MLASHHSTIYWPDTCPTRAPFTPAAVTTVHFRMAAVSQETRAQQVLRAKDMGISIEEYLGLGFDDTSADDSPSIDPAGPASARQHQLLNDMSILPSEWPATRGDASKLIASRMDTFKSFMDSHNGDKPVTGKQRASLLTKGITADAIDGMTKAQASEQLGNAARGNEMTPAQRSLLEKLGCTDFPETVADASNLIQQLIGEKNKPTDKQLALLRKLNKSLGNETLSRLTGAQASALIAALLAKANAKKRKPAKDGGSAGGAGRKRGRKEDDNDDDGGEVPRGTGAYD